MLLEPFRALRPVRELAAKVACPPYDVLDSDEARAMAKGNEHSFLHVEKPEIDLPLGIDIHDGRVYEYRNPLSGGPIMPTMGAQLQLLARGEETKAHRHTGSAIYQVAKGRGWSEIAGQRFDWEEKDIFALPSWALHRHGAHEESVLFSFNDIPAMKALALYREAN